MDRPVGAPRSAIDTSRVLCQPRLPDFRSAAWSDCDPPPPPRAQVQVVAIDMCTVFKAAVRDSLPHVSTWWPQILAAITTDVTDAASEGINRAIKTDAVHLYANAL
jgi:hypothetical protein